jgi:hypothetical protein
MDITRENEKKSEDLVNLEFSEIIKMNGYLRQRTKPSIKNR